MTAERKQKIIKDNAQSKGDTGSPEVQVAILTERITKLADGYQATPREDVAADLYEVERHLQAADRRLRTLVAKLDG